MLNAFDDTDDGFYLQNVLLAEETRPSPFLGDSAGRRKQHGFTD
jgi:hypothetical protein